MSETTSTNETDNAEFREIDAQELDEAMQLFEDWLADHGTDGRQIYEVCGLLTTIFNYLHGPEAATVLQVLRRVEREMVADAMQNHLKALDEFLADPPGGPHGLREDCPFLADAGTCTAVHETLAALWGHADELFLALWPETPAAVREAFVATYAWRDRHRGASSLICEPGAVLLGHLLEAGDDGGRAALDSYIRSVRRRQAAMAEVGWTERSTSCDELIVCIETIRDALPFEMYLPVAHWSRYNDEDDAPEEDREEA